MRASLKATLLIAVASLVEAGCSVDGGGAGLVTQSIVDPQATKVQAECRELAARVDALGGAADRVAKAAAKSYRLTDGDVKRADLLNKANSEFKAKCMNVALAQGQAKPIAP